MFWNMTKFIGCACWAHNSTCWGWGIQLYTLWKILAGTRLNNNWNLSLTWQSYLLRRHTMLGRRIILVMLVGNKSALGEHLLLHIWVKASRCELCERAWRIPVKIQDHAALIHCKYTATFIIQKDKKFKLCMWTANPSLVLIQLLKGTWKCGI